MLFLVAALSLASPLTVTTIDVPYLPQTDALCGGAAAAMVLRYWGDAHIRAQDFERLVDRRAGGIADTTLVDDIERRGWQIDRVRGSLAQIDDRLMAGEPIIVLLADRGSRYHYVVVVGHRGGTVIVHDPAWGPSRVIPDPDFLGRWERSEFWSLVIRPGAQMAELGADANRTSSPTSPSSSGDVEAQTSDSASCQTQLHAAIVDAAQRDLDTADRLLSEVRRLCPDSAGPLRELAGIRFAERRWRDAADLASRALQRDPRDEYASDVLGSSLFMLNDAAGALRAWNRIHKPVLDQVRIEGLHHSRYDAIADALRLTPGVLLTARDFELARRRLDDLPDHVSARLALRPDVDGFATVDVVIAERPSLPDSAPAWSGTALAAAVDRELAATAPGFTGQGDTWSAAWRFWSNRPRVALGFAAPRLAGLPGVWRVEASWDAETYALPNSPALSRQSRTRAAVSVSDWVAADWRYSLSAGVDQWNAGTPTASLGAAIERRLADDRLSIVAHGDTWIARASGLGFTSVGLRGGWTSRPVTSGWVYVADGGWQRVSDNAPIGLWPGADDGHGRSQLLRAHPILEDGIINLTDQSAFGRTLAFGNAEVQRWFVTTWPTGIGLAGFTDLARATRDARGMSGPFQIDVGTGLRLRVPGVRRVLRIDVAHGLRDGANAVSVGWGF